MKYLILLIISTNLCYALPRRMEKKVTEAIYAYPEIKLAIKNTENQLNITENQIRLSALGISTAMGTFDTRYIKNLRIKHNDYQVKPRIIWDYRENELRSLIEIKWTFP